MNATQYASLEAYMLMRMTDSAHDREHIYRVLYTALDIAQTEADVDYDVLIASCLLHDIGREAQFRDPAVCHAQAGAEQARAYLLQNGYDAAFAERVAACIRAHRFRSDREPESIEAKILFDADKIDATGTLGIARTIFYKGQTSEPLYSLEGNGTISDGTGDETASFFQEYKFKLEGLYTKFYTRRAHEIARSRQASAARFYTDMLREVRQTYEAGKPLLKGVLSEPEPH